MRLDAQHANRIAAQMRVPNHHRLGASHAGPSLQRSMVLVNHRSQHSADIEWLLASGVGFVGEDIADAHEAAGTVVAVRISLDVAVDGIAGCGLAGEALARSKVGVIVMTEEDMAGFIDVARKILRLPIRVP